MHGNRLDCDIPRSDTSHPHFTTYAIFQIEKSDAIASFYSIGCFKRKWNVVWSHACLDLYA